MKQTATLVFPHQLIWEHPLTKDTDWIILVEELLFFRQVPFHKQKLAFHRASMKAFQDHLISKVPPGCEVTYVEATDPLSDIRELLRFIGQKGFSKIRNMDPVDDWLNRRIREAAREYHLTLETSDAMQFINSHEEVEAYFFQKKQFRQTNFYIKQRKQRGYLLTGAGDPRGGKWTYDAENRKKYPAAKKAPAISYPDDTPFHREAREYVEKHFPGNPGSLDPGVRYPVTPSDTLTWLDLFLHERFESFGSYQDAMLKNGSNLHHSLVSPMLNAGLITPGELLNRVIAHGERYNTPMNSLEGFVRQVLGWREFLRGVYVSKGGYQRTLNFWGFERKIPASFWKGTTGIEPVDLVIQKVLTTGYAHHIERLMVLGNFMLLCEFDPDEVYSWFMALFIDAYDWVMVPNVYGMSQFADGGLMSTKPYISSSNYLRKMGDFEPGPWQEVWDALFWRFMNVHRKQLSRNPRLRMLISSYDKMNEEKRSAYVEKAEAYLSSI
jgi:deoxyribodipyrimidine photolyase-related protein